MNNNLVFFLMHVTCDNKFSRKKLNVVEKLCLACCETFGSDYEFELTAKTTY